MRNMTKRAVVAMAGACALGLAAFGTASAADLPLTAPPAPQAQVVPPHYYAPPPNYYAPPPVQEEAYPPYPPPVAYEYPPPPPTYYAYAPPPAVVVPQPYYWGPRVAGPFIGRGYYAPPFGRPYERFAERGWGRGYRGW